MFGFLNTMFGHFFADKEREEARKTKIAEYKKEQARLKEEKYSHLSMSKDPDVIREEVLRKFNSVNDRMTEKIILAEQRQKQAYVNNTRRDSEDTAPNLILAAAVMSGMSSGSAEETPATYTPSYSGGGGSSGGGGASESYSYSSDNSSSYSSSSSDSGGSSSSD